MVIRVTADGWLRWRRQRVPCALGRAGVKRDKGEGDGATPAGCWPLRRVLYRRDRLGAPPATSLPLRPIRAEDGWCDDPCDPAYNRPLRLPHSARHERLWRDDGLYDLLIVVGYNDGPPLPGRGSAIFVHVARHDYAPTEGCIALAMADLRRLLAACAPGDRLLVSAAPASA